MRKYLWLLYTPILALYLGMVSNALVMAVNHAQMPVLWPGGDNDTCQTTLAAQEDMVHSCMTHATHLKILADWIVVSEGIASPGDMGIFFYEDFFWPMAGAYIALIVFGGNREMVQAQVQDYRSVEAAPTVYRPSRTTRGFKNPRW